MGHLTTSNHFDTSRQLSVTIVAGSRKIEGVSTQTLQIRLSE
jgi:hypothetical protein